MSTALWTGEFGDAYTRRNRLDWEKRVPFWREMTATLEPENVLEVGCNAGWNLRAIAAAGTNVRQCLGIDANMGAVVEALQAGLNAAQMPAEYMTFDGIFDFVFTAGVLIHVPPATLPRVMENIIRASRRYVLAIEYAAGQEEEVPYRDQRDALWRRPYGALYEAMGLQLKYGGVADQRNGFDDCVYWLLEKPQP